MSILAPSKYKHRKVRKGRNNGIATRSNYVAFGDFGLMSLDNKDITGRQIEAARQAISRQTARGGKMWIRIFPHIPITRKPLDVKMGSGKGDLAWYAAKVKTGTVMFEIGGVKEEIAKEALRLAGHKLPVRVKIVEKEGRIELTDEQIKENIRKTDAEAAFKAESVPKTAEDAPKDLTNEAKSDIIERKEQ
jgi:large subunit ribosomal protein L16